MRNLLTQVMLTCCDRPVMVTGEMCIIVLTGRRGHFISLIYSTNVLRSSMTGLQGR